MKLSDEYSVIRGIKEVDGQPMFNDDVKPRVIQLEQETNYQIKAENEALQKALDKALGAIDGEREPCPLCGVMFWAGSFGHNEDCLVYKKETL